LPDGPVKGPISYTINQARIAYRASLSWRNIRARHFHIIRIAFIAVFPMFVVGVQKHEARRFFDSPGFAGNSDR